jgi:hypothetical protein
VALLQGYFTKSFRSITVKQSLIMDKVYSIFNQAINDPLIVTLAVLCLGVFSAFAVCEIGSRFGKFVTFISGDES